MAQKIKVNTVLELDGTEYSVTIAPITKKVKKKIEKAFNKEKDASQDYIDMENSLNNLNSDIELTQELLDATEDMGEKRKLILEKKSLITAKRETEKTLESQSSEVREKIADMQERMFESIFDEMVSGEDVESLKSYVKEYSFEMVVKQINEVYEKELEGK